MDPIENDYDAKLALDQNGNRVINAEANVYAASDTTFSTPLVITDSSGHPLDKLRSNSDGIYPAFRVPSGALQINVKSGDRVTPMTSLAVYAQVAAQMVGEATALVVQAESNANIVAGMKDDVDIARTEVLAVGNTNDTIIEGRIKATGSKTELALRDKIAALSPTPQNSVVIIGPSLEEQIGQGAGLVDPTFANAQASSMRARGWFHWANGFLGNALDLVYNAGVGGDTFAGMLARFESDVMSRSSRFVIIGSPTNSITGGASLATILGQLQSMIDLARAGGRDLIVLNCGPRDTFTTTTRRVIAAEYNRAVALLPLTQRGVTVADQWSAVQDPSTGAPLAGTTVDGTHWSISGAALIGRAVADAIRPFISLTRPQLTSFSADPRRAINNPEFLDTGAGWAATSGATAAFAKASRGHGNKATVAIAGNSSLTALRGVTRTDLLSDDLFAAGDVVQATVLVRWSNLVPLAGNTPCQPILRVEQLTGADASVKTAHSLYSASSEWATGSTDPLPMPASGEMVLTTWQSTIAGTTAKIRTLLGWIGAASVDLEFEHLAVLKSTANTQASPSEPPADTTPEPVDRPDSGVAGYSNRWLASELEVAGGTAISSWVDAEFGDTLAQGTSGYRPTVQTVSGTKVVRFDGVDDFLAVTGLDAWNSIVVIGRMAAGADEGIVHGLFQGGSGGDIGVTRGASTSQLRPGIFWAGNRLANAPAPLYLTTDEQFVMQMRQDTGDAAFRLNSLTPVTNTAADSTTTATTLDLGRRTTSYGAVEIVEVILYPFGLTDAQMDTIHATALTNYPGLFA